MKRFIPLLLCLFVFASCNTEQLSVKDNSLTKIVFSGDMVDISSKPLSKSGTDMAYYAFVVNRILLNVYETYPYPFADVPELVTDTLKFERYAEGLFTQDSLDNMEIYLEPNVGEYEGCMYEFYCMAIENRVDRLYVDSDGFVYQPFAKKDQRTRITNQFVYSNESTISFSSEYCINNGDVITYAELDKYYGGACTNYPAESITINMQRHNFGIHFQISPPKEGSLKVYHDSPRNLFSYELTSSSTPVDEEYVYASYGGYLKLKVELTKEDGTVLDYSPGYVSFENRTITTIKVDIQIPEDNSSGEDNDDVDEEDDDDNSTSISIVKLEGLESKTIEIK